MCYCGVAAEVCFKPFSDLAYVVLSFLCVLYLARRAIRTGRTPPIRILRMAADCPKIPRLKYTYHRYGIAPALCLTTSVTLLLIMGLVCCQVSYACLPLIYQYLYYSTCFICSQLIPTRARASELHSSRNIKSRKVEWHRICILREESQFFRLCRQLV